MYTLFCHGHQRSRFNSMYCFGFLYCTIIQNFIFILEHDLCIACIQSLNSLKITSLTSGLLFPNMEYPAQDSLYNCKSLQQQRDLLSYVQMRKLALSDDLCMEYLHFYYLSSLPWNKKEKRGDVIERKYSNTLERHMTIIIFLRSFIFLKIWGE